MSRHPAPTDLLPDDLEVPPFACVSTAGTDGLRVTLSGELDLATVPRLDAALRRADRGADVVVDLRRLTYIDCSGANVLIAADRRIRQAGGELLVVRGAGYVAWYFEVMSLPRWLDVVERPLGLAAFATVRRERPAQHLVTEAHLEAVTGERDELRLRVRRLEEELLELVDPTMLQHDAL